MDDYDETSGTLAREAGTSVVTINRYAEAGLLQYRQASDGTRLFKRGQSPVVHEHLAQRLANRGNRSRG